MKISYEMVNHEDQASIVELGEAVNEEFVIPCLSPEGQKNMRKARQVDIKRAIDTDIYTAVKAVKDGQIVGYVSWRQGNYIAQLYVSSKYPKKGIGRELVSEMRRRSGSSSIELKASVNAVSFYKRLGFKPIDKEQVKDGIRYLPMLFISDE